MKDKNLNQLKEEYMNMQIPDKFDYVVDRTIADIRVNRRKRKNIFRWCTAAAAVIIIFTTGINSSPTFAKTMSEVPIVGSIVKILAFREYKVDEDSYKADIKVPAISGLQNKSLENSLNEKYLNENKQLYDNFIAEMKKLKENGDGNLGINSGYVIKTDTDNIMSVGRYVANTVGSSSTTFKYDTIDKKNEILIMLPSLFKDDNYIDIISENIKKQMVEQNKADRSKFYWVSGIEQNSTITLFDKISKDQNFYINSEGKLVISFDKYEVAPGYMGIVEFVIPTDSISDILVGNDYIK